MIILVLCIGRICTLLLAMFTSVWLFVYCIYCNEDGDDYYDVLIMWELLKDLICYIMQHECRKNVEKM